MNHRFLKKLQDFAIENIDEEGHGFDHFMAVFNHVQKALEWNVDLCQEKKKLIQYAALLHDVDDAKFFPLNKNYENAREFLIDESLTNEQIEQVILMISLVSCSSNGNEKPSHIKDWMLYPRHADRLEAVGEIGIQRAISFGTFLGRSMHDEHTERVFNLEQLESAAPKSRFDDYVYKKKSAKTTIGHFYDKILHIADVKTGNPYFDRQFRLRYDVIVEFILNYWKEH